MTRGFSLLGIDPLPPLATTLPPPAVRRKIQTLASGRSRAELEVQFDGDHFVLRRRRSRLELAVPTSLTGRIAPSDGGSVITATARSAPGALGYLAAFVAFLIVASFWLPEAGIPLMPALPLLALVFVAASVVGVWRGNADRSALATALRAVVRP